MAYMYVCRVGKVNLSAKLGFLLFFVLLQFQGFAQVGLTNGAPTAFIDFSASMPVNVGSASASAFAGGGFQPPPVAPGRLNSNAWSVTRPGGGNVFDPSGTLPFGGTQIPPSNDFARGATTVAQTTGGIYAFTGLPGSAANPVLMIQPAVNDFTPGEITLRIQNNGTSAITQFAISYDLFIRNDQGRSNSFNFSWSTNNTVYNNVGTLDYTSPDVADLAGWVQVGTSPSRSTTITSQNIAPGSYFYIRWTGADVGGSGSRDEFGLDNINIAATYGVACSPPGTNATGFGFSNVLPGQMDVSFTRGNGTGGLMVVAVENATLSSNPNNSVIYAANTNYGTGAVIGNGFVVYNSNAVLPAPGGTGSFSIYGLNPSTTYNFYFIEFNGVGSPCYQLVYPTASQATIAATASASGYFRSRATGNWNNANTWQYSPDNGVTPWVISDLRPTSAAAGISIEPTHTVTLVSNESAAKLTINATGILDNTNGINGGYYLTMVDKAGDDLTVNGTLKLYGNIPTQPAGLNVVVNTGGMVQVLNNSGDANSDNFARSAQVKFYTNAIFNWNTILAFESDNATYFTSGAADVPVFRVTSTVTVGATNPTVIHGLLEVNAVANFQNSGLKTFRNGITGTATLNQLAGSGNFLVSATAALGAFKIGGTGAINLTSELQFAGNSFGVLISNKTINGSIARVLSTGELNTDIFTLSGTTNFTVDAGAFLGIGSPVGITTGATGNIQTTTRTLSTAAGYKYTGYANQVTGNLLPATVASLYVQGPPVVGTAAIVTLNNPVIVTGTTFMLNGWFLDIGTSTLTCNGALTYGAGGMLKGNALSNLILTGATAQALTFVPASELALFTIKKTGGTALLNSALKINTGIFFDPTNTGTTNFNAQSVTLRSGPTHTAYFSRRYGTVQNATKFTVERYIPTGTDHGRSWQLLAVPLNTIQTINQAWQDTATSANQSRYAGYGTMITGATNDPLFTLGFDAYTPLGATVKTFVAGPVGSYLNIPNTKSTAITNKKGYMVLVRGDRTVTAVSGPNSTAVPTRLRATGTLYEGPANPPPTTTIAAGNFESVANPYACTVDFTLVFKNGGTDNIFYVWDPLLPGSSNLGGYQTLNGAVGFLPSPGGTTNYPTGVAVTTIQSGQAVLMHATGSIGNISFADDDKVITSDNVFRQPLRNSMLQAHLYTSAGALADGNIAAFGNQFSNDYDGRDAVKATNTGENFGIAAHSKVISVLTRRPVVYGDTIQYQMWNLPRGRFNLKFTPENFEGREEAFLVDRYTRNETPVSRSVPTEYAFEISNDAASYQANRFYIVFRRGGHREDVEREPAITIAPNPVTGNRVGVVLKDIPEGAYQVMLMQAGGQVIVRQPASVKSGREVFYLNLPPSVVPGVYRLVLSGRQWQGDARVVVQ